MSWPHGETMGPDQAVSLLQALKCNLSRSLHPELQALPQEVIQVWFEPLPDRSATTGQAGPPLPILTLTGRLQVTPQTLSWTPVHSPGLLLEALARGGRVLIRIHCGYLYDAKRRPFSAALDALLQLDSLRLPGGALESWFFIKG